MQRARHVCPAGFIDRPVDRTPASGARQQAVLVQQQYVGSLATGHLLDEGRRRVVHISAGAGWPTEQRLLGYQNTFAARGIALERQWIVQAKHATDQDVG